MTAHLQVTLAPGARGIRVRWRLDGVELQEGEPLCRLPLTIAGAPTLELDDGLLASDAAGALPLTASLVDDADDGETRRWSVGRTTSGSVEVSYLAEPVAAEPAAATPPLELRAEEGGLSGAVKCFVVLPTGPDDLSFELRWSRPSGPDGPDVGWTAVCSLGDGDGDQGELAGAGLERLGDTYVMCGDLQGRHHRDGQLSTWWLTSPRIDIEAFSRRLGATYQVMSEAFDAPTHAYRVFLRAHPHRGANASAHPASFVMALNPDDPLDEAAIYETIAHELVHEWLHLDGPADEVTWFNEGSADYFSLVLPLRAGLVDDDAFLRAVNFEAREAYASLRRDLSMKEAQPRFFSDFLAHRLPYARGLLYLADLDARLRAADAAGNGVDDVVRGVLEGRRTGERVGVEQWCALVEQVSSVDEMPFLDALVFSGHGRPGHGSFGPQFVMETVQVPVLDLGFDPSTWMSGRITGLVPGGAADRAGLCDGELVELPRYSEILRKDVGDVLDIVVTRGGERVPISLPLNGETVPVPQWFKADASGVGRVTQPGGSSPGRRA